MKMRMNSKGVLTLDLKFPEGCSAFVLMSKAVNQQAWVVEKMFSSPEIEISEVQEVLNKKRADIETIAVAPVRCKDLVPVFEREENLRDASHKDIIAAAEKPKKT